MQSSNAPRVGRARNVSSTAVGSTSAATSTQRGSLCSAVFARADAVDAAERAGEVGLVGEAPAVGEGGDVVVGMGDDDVEVARQLRVNNAAACTSTTDTTATRYPRSAQCSNPTNA